MSRNPHLSSDSQITCWSKYKNCTQFYFAFFIKKITLKPFSLVSGFGCRMWNWGTFERNFSFQVSGTSCIFYLTVIAYSAFIIGFHSVILPCSACLSGYNGIIFNRLYIICFMFIGKEYMIKNLYEKKIQIHIPSMESLKS